MKDFIRFSKKIVLLCVPLVALIYGLGAFDNMIVRNNLGMIYKIQDSKNYDSLDYLVIGGSYAYSDISCFPFDSMHLRYYNLGEPAASSDYYEMILNDYLSHVNQPPKNILMMLSPIMFCDICDNWTDYTLHRNLLTPLTNEKVLMKYNIGLKNYSVLVMKSAQLGFQNIFFRASHTSFQPEDYFKDTRGYLVRPNEITSKDTAVLTEPWKSMHKRDFAEVKYTHLVALLNTLKEKGIRVIFYEPPTFYTERYFTERFLKSYENAVNKLRQSGYLIIRRDGFSNMVKMENFSDIDHMNHKGAFTYTTRLLAELYPSKQQ